MCKVHRIVKDSESGLTAAISFEHVSNDRRITPSTSAVLQGRTLVMEADTSVTITFEAPAKKSKTLSITRGEASPQNNLGRERICRPDIDERGRRRATLRTCDRNPQERIYRERDSHGFHGRKPVRDY